MKRLLVRIWLLLAGLGLSVENGLPTACAQTQPDDFGDAPAPYPTLSADNGARHTLEPGFCLGQRVDGELDGRPDPDAAGDDQSNPPGELSDEDGVQWLTPLIRGGLATIQLTVALPSDQPGEVNAWIDFDQNARWDDPGEYIFMAGAWRTGTHTFVVAFQVPPWARRGVTYARFRLSHQVGLGYDGPAPDGEVEDYRVEIVPAIDWGDAPDPYPTVGLQGARHILEPEGPILGALVDAEPNGQMDPQALGDDQQGLADEDGVRFLTPLVPGQSARLEVVSPRGGQLNAWVDFGGDRGWMEDEDHFLINVPLTQETNVAAFEVPATAQVGATFARFRVSTGGSPTPDGEAPDGEVEDYLVAISAPAQLDFGDAPPPYPTLLADNGARHGLEAEFCLGQRLDGEVDGQFNRTATADDTDPPGVVNDEDGIVFPAALVPGNLATVEVWVTLPGNATAVLNGWLDFDGANGWADAGEQILQDVPVGSGMNTLTFAVPTTAKVGTTFARFRLSRQGGLGYTGPASEGEVEDQAVEIAPPGTISGRKWHDLNGNAVPEEGERGLGGWTVYLDRNGNGQRDGDEPWKVTDATGEYRFSWLAPGSYVVAEEVQPGWSQSYPTYAPRIELISRGPGGELGNNVSCWPSVSGDGRYVAFDSSASNLVPGDTGHENDVLVYDRLNRAIERVSVDTAGNEGNNYSNFPSISADGRFVAFRSEASNLVAGDTNQRDDVFVYDRLNRAIERVSVDAAGNEGNENSSFPAISADGCFVAFGSEASNLVPGDTNQRDDVFVYDRLNRTIERVSVSAAGNQGNGNSITPSISGNGRYVAFASYASNLVPGATGSIWYVFVYDRSNRTIECVSVDATGNAANAASRNPSISADGRYVAFDSPASNLVPGDTEDPLTGLDVFVHDRLNRTIEMVSVDAAGNGGSGPSEYPSISADGRYVAFASSAANLVPGDTNQRRDVFVWDRQSCAVERVSVDAHLAEGVDSSDFPSISADGVYVAFYSEASNLVPGDTNGFPDVFLVQRTAATWPDAHRLLVGPGQTLRAVDFGNWQPVDFGDAPAPYPTSVADNGARHTLETGFCLGQRVDGELDGRPDPDAAGDDQCNPPGELNDEDGVEWLTPLTPGAGAALAVRVTVPTGQTAVLNAWIDFGQNPGWDDPGEHVIEDVAVTAFFGCVLPVPASARTGVTYARFRLSRQGGLGYGGPAPDGEVEDYRVEIVPAIDWGDAPDPYPTVGLQGARHILEPEGPILGAWVDAEPNGQIDPQALGDDRDGLADEDGVRFLTPLVPGQSARVEVVSPRGGQLNAWIDFGGDRGWLEDEDHFLISVPLPQETNVVTFEVPATAQVGPTFARFRVSTGGSPTPDGEAPDGEVEDYLVAIAEGQAPPLHAPGTVVSWGLHVMPYVPPETRYTALSAGYGHTLALATDGTVIAWGHDNGRPCVVPDGLRARAISAGDKFSLAVRADGQVLAWGYNVYGRCTVPSGLSNALAVAAGLNHSIALRNDGTVTAWGANSVHQTDVPERLGAVTAIAAGANHNLALVQDGTVVAWGDGRNNQTAVPAGLADVIAVAAGRVHSLALRRDGWVVAWGTGSAASVPPGLEGVAAIAAGADHSLALLGNGRMVAWGLNTSGQANVPPDLANVVAITAGDLYSVALRANGTFAAWGANTYGQCMAPGTVTGAIAVAAGNNFSLALQSDGRVVGWGTYGDTIISTSPVLAGLSNIVAIAAGGAHAVALRSDGTAVAWPSGQPATAVADLENVVAIGAKGVHTLALQADGTVIARGGSPYGSGENSVPPGLPQAVAIAAGTYHNLMVDRAGGVRAWGYNLYHQTEVPNGLADVIDIAGGSVHSLALTRDGRVVGWGGTAAYGEGIPPSGLPAIAAIAAGNNHNLLLGRDGTVVAWGYNVHGETNVPPGLDRVSAIAAGPYQSVAVRAAPAAPPDLEPPQIACSPNIVTNAAPGECGRIIHFESTATDNADPNPTVRCSPPSDSFFPVGTTRVQCLATDASGNRGSCGFDVTVTATLVRLSLRKNIDGTVTFEWPGEGMLESGPEIIGPWTTVAGANSPYSVLPTEPALFARVRFGTEYSSNAVGYVNLTLRPGFSLIGNPLVAADNTVVALLDGLPNGVSVFKHCLATGHYFANNFLHGWSDAAMTLLPGEGFWVHNPYATNLSLTLLGDVAQGRTGQSSPAGFDLLSSIVPQAGMVETDLKLPAKNSDRLYKWQVHAYAIFTRLTSAWKPPEPTIAIGEGFFYKAGAAGTWDRDFEANPFPCGGTRPAWVMPPDGVSASSGNVNFFTFNTNAALGRVYDMVDCQTPLASPYCGQLYAGADSAETSLVPVGEPVGFLSGLGAGYIRSGAVEVPGTAGGDIYLQLRVWNTNVHVWYEDAWAAGDKVGKSEVFHVLFDPMAQPTPVPPTANGFHSFCLSIPDTEPPVIDREPPDATAPCGGSASFSIVASGTGPLSYQWQRNGAPIAGATSPTFTIANVGLIDNGSLFTVVVANIFGSVTSRTATLVVVDTVTITVTSLADSGPGSLRAAIAAAAPCSTITFAPGLTGTIILTDGELLIGTTLTIIGPGANAIRVSGNRSTRVFNIVAGTVRITDLTITGGITADHGGGLANSGDLTLERCVFVGNVASSPGSLGGAIRNDGHLSLNCCTLSRNRASGGGAIDTTGPLALSHCTLAFNSAQDGGGGALALEPLAGCLASLTNCTLAYNSAQYAGGIFNAAGALFLQNCIVARNTSFSSNGALADVVPGCTSLGHNLIGNTSGTSGWVDSDLLGSDAGRLDPGLGPLLDNGGPTPTMALFPDSPAVDAGISGGAVSDQRGRRRPQDDPTVPNTAGGDASDIGAYERDVTANFWVSAASGKWETGSNWWAGPPSSAHWPLLIHNAASKTVTLDNVTATHPSVMSITDLSISAPTGSSNTLNVCHSAGPPLNIASNLVIQDGGALVLNGGSVAAGSLVLTNAGAQVTLNRGTLTLHSSTVSNGTEFLVGDGVSAAVLRLPTGTHSFPDGLTIAPNATLEIGCATVTGPIHNLGLIVFSCSNALACVADIVNAGMLVADATLVELHGSLINTGDCLAANSGDFRFYGPLVAGGSFTFGQPATLDWVAFDPLARADANTTVTVKLQFNKPLASGSMVNPDNYGFAPGSLAACSASADGLTVLLSIANAPSPGIPYTLSFTNLTDLAGNRLAGQVIQGSVPFYAVDYALSGTASQSSIAPGTDPHFAIDGVTEGTFTNNSVTLNAYPETNGWWEVDLGAAVPIQQVQVWFRTDYGNGLPGVPGPARNDDFTLEILDAARMLVWTNTHLGTPPRQVAYTYAAPLPGRYVRFESQRPLTTSDGYFSLAEVAVLAPYADYGLAIWQDLPDTMYPNTNGLVFLGPLIAHASNAPNSALQYQWQGTFGTSNTWTDIPAATSNAYPATLLSSNNAPQYYRCRVSLLNSNLYSHATQALPLPPPKVTTFRHELAGDNVWTVTAHFNVPVTADSVTTLANYSFDYGTLLEAVAGHRHQSVTLTVSNLGDRQGNYTLTIANVTDRNGYGAGLTTTYRNNVSGRRAIQKIPTLNLAANAQANTNVVLTWPTWASVGTSHSISGPWEPLNNPNDPSGTNQLFTLNVPITEEPMFFKVLPSALGIFNTAFTGDTKHSYLFTEGNQTHVYYTLRNGHPPLIPPIPAADWDWSAHEFYPVGYVVAYVLSNLGFQEVARQEVPWFEGEKAGGLSFPAPYAGDNGDHYLWLNFSNRLPGAKHRQVAFSDFMDFPIGPCVLVGLEDVQILTTMSYRLDTDTALIAATNYAGGPFSYSGWGSRSNLVALGDRGGTWNNPVTWKHPIKLYLGPFDMPANILTSPDPAIGTVYSIINGLGSYGLAGSYQNVTAEALDALGDLCEIGGKVFGSTPIGLALEILGYVLDLVGPAFTSCNGVPVATAELYYGLGIANIPDGATGAFVEQLHYSFNDVHGDCGWNCPCHSSQYYVHTRVYRNSKLYKIKLHTAWSSNISGYPADEVHIWLRGTRNQSCKVSQLLETPMHGCVVLDCNSYVGTWEKGKAFVVPYPDVGEVTSVQIRAVHHSYATSDDAWWTLAMVEVEDLMEPGHWCFFNDDGLFANIPLPVDQPYEITLWPLSVVKPGSPSPCP